MDANGKGRESRGGGGGGGEEGGESFFFLFFLSLILFNSLHMYEYWDLTPRMKVGW